MCLTMPARIIAVEGGWAEIEVDGVLRRASTLPVPDIRPGDWAIVAAGTVVRRLEPELAREIAQATRAARDPSEPSAMPEAP
jgi:hydrogenase assembly chaperone HypC/HupF